MGATIAVEMGETRVSSTLGDRLVATGLGACVGLCLYDSWSRIAAMIHVVLPQTLPVSLASPAAALPGKCADTAVPHAIAEIARHGGKVANLRAAVIGGSQIFSHSSLTSRPVGASPPSLSRLEIGARNIIAVKDALAAAGIPLVAEEVGGHCGRTVTFFVHSGQVHVRAIGAEEQHLVALGQDTLPLRGEMAREGAASHGR